MRGDGGITMLMSDPIAAVQEKFPIKITGPVASSNSNTRSRDRWTATRSFRPPTSPPSRRREGSGAGESIAKT